jgi:hypothetical protein
MFWGDGNICGSGDCGDVIVQGWEEGQVGHLQLVIMDRAKLFADSLCNRRLAPEKNIPSLHSVPWALTIAAEQV